MKLANACRHAALIGLIAGLAMSPSATAVAEERITWKMQSAIPSKLSILGEAVLRFERNIETMSGGTLRLKLYEPNALVPALEGFDAVKIGSIDAMWGASAYHAGKIPALSWFTAVPFGPRAGEYLAWLRYGGGDVIYDEIYAAHGLKGFHCLIIAPEASGWFREEIRSADDLKGLKVRYGGLGAKVMTKMGASTQLLAPADIYPALERGVIDATEFSMPEIDLAFGFHQVAKHYYFPGWHQQATIGELLVNLENWQALPERHKAIIEVACGDSLSWSLVRSEALQFKAMQELQAKGVTIHRWPDSILVQFEEKWQEVVEAESAKDPLFKRIYESFRAFREQYAIWREHGYMD
jgi:TRAP-type mannitol/chloroaromatic compound transport system substrate-binding protein